MAVIAPGIRSQTQLDDLLDFSGSIATGGTAQLVLPQQPGRLSLFIANPNATDAINIGIGPPPCTVTMSGSAPNQTVSSISAVNVGIGYSATPNVRLLGGLFAGDYKNAPAHPATAHAVMSGSAPNQTIASIVVDDPGVGYSVAPLVWLENPWPKLGGGAFLPSATTGIKLPAGWTFSSSGMMVVPGSAVAIVAPTNGDTYTVKVGGLV